MLVIPIVLSISLLGQAAENKATLEALQKRVDATQIELLTGEGKKAVEADLKLVEKPVFRYSDELREIEAAGIWLWTDRNRPVAAMKVEKYRPGRLSVPWLYCFTSLSPGLVRAEWVDAMPYQSRKPGVAWQPLDDEPAGSRPARLVQLGVLARRFSAEIQGNPEGTDQTQMRLLTRPLLRCEESSAVLDGAIFGFTGTGTNPDLLLLLDLPPSGGWRFGAATMTAEGVRLKLNDNLVFENEHTANQGTTFDTWCYFCPAK